MAASFNTARVERRDGRTAWTSLNRPDRANALSAGAAGRPGGQRQSVFRGCRCRL